MFSSGAALANTIVLCKQRAYFCDLKKTYTMKETLSEYRALLADPCVLSNQVKLNNDSIQRRK